MSLLLFIIFIGAVSCDDMMNDYQKYIEGGEIIYSGKIDSVKVYPGRDRVLITGLFISDPKITTCKIYWDSRIDSVSEPVVRTAGVDTLKSFIEVSEGTHSFEIITYDKDGNISVPVYVTGTAYGDKYESGLLSRGVSSSNTKAGLVLTLSPADDTNKATFVTYETTSGEQKTVTIPALTETYTIPDNYGKRISVVSSFIPENGIDTFYSASETRTFNPYAGTYWATGVFHNSTGEDRPIDEIKALARINDSTVQCSLGDMGSSGYYIQLTVDPDNTVTIAPEGSTPDIDQHWGENYYDPVAKEFHLHYSYNTSAPYIVEETLTLK